MDDSSVCSNCNNEKISLRLSKDSSNRHWLVNNCHTNQCKHIPSKKVSKKARKQKPSFKVSLPICVWDAMQEQNSAEFKKPTSPTPMLPPPPKEALALRLPPPHTQPARLPLPAPLSPSGLRMFRCPVPTSKGRTSLADKFEQIIKAPKPIQPKKIFQRTISMPILPGDVPPATKDPAIDPEKNKTEHSHIANKPNPSTDTCLSRNLSLETPLPIKHKLPFTVVPQKGSYVKKITNPINKENTNTCTQTTAEQLTQTEKCLIVTEDEIQLLEIVKNSGLTSDELQIQLDNFKKEKEQISENDCLVIDLESNSETDANDIYDKIIKHSTNNKFVLNKIAKILEQNSGFTSQPATSPHEPPSNLSTSTAEQQTPLTSASALKDRSTPAVHPQKSRVLEVNDIQKGFAVSAMLLQMGFRIVRIEPNTQGTQTEEHRENNKKRKLNPTIDENQPANELLGRYEQTGQRQSVVPVIHPPVVSVQPSQEMPALVPLKQEIPVLQPPNPPRPFQLSQPYGHEHIERPSQDYSPNMGGLISHQRAQNALTRNQHFSSMSAHNPFEHSRSNTTFSTPQPQVQMPTPSLLHPNDTRRLRFHGQVPTGGHGHPHLSRVPWVSTHEANMHGSQAHQPGWNYQNYYDNGNVYPQRHL